MSVVRSDARFAMRSVVVVLALLVVCSSVRASDKLPPGIQWQTDLNAAHRLSQQTGRPMLFIFGAEWCTWCKRLEKTTLGDAELARFINQNFVPIHIDADKDPRVTRILEAESLPCTVILSPGADLLGRFNGYKDVRGFREALTLAQSAGQGAVASSEVPQMTLQSVPQPMPGMMPRPVPAMSTETAPSQVRQVRATMTTPMPAPTADKGYRPQAPRR